MSTRKGQNSILFLTTSGVYLGLVLAGGASPQVFAHPAATTRNFDITDEIEFKDDLDKKPDDNLDDLVRSVRDYFSELGSFVSDLQKLHQIDKFDPDYDTFKTNQVLFQPCPETGGELAEETTSDIDKWLKPALTDAKYRTEGWTWLADCNASDKFKEANRKEARSATLTLSFDKKVLKYELSITRSGIERTESLFQGLTDAFNSIDKTDFDSRENVLWKNTQLRKSGNQVFIVTNLPRASLDDLLAKDAK